MHLPAATVLRETEVKVRAIDRTAGLSRLQAFLAPQCIAPAEESLLREPLSHLLASGGDHRIALDPATGLNKYLCGTTPRTDVVSYASCTASTLSPGAEEAAEQCRARLVAQLRARPLARLLAEEAGEIGSRILRHYGVEDVAEALLAPSGTDATLLLMGMLAADKPQAPITSILCSTAETGSGVPLAAAGRHFAAVSAGGIPLPQGAPLAGFPPHMEVRSVRLRTSAGALRPAAAVDADCAALARAAAAAGRVVVHLIDGSKTGLCAPGMECARAIEARYPGRAEIVVDACQARLSAGRLRQYLLFGWPVLVTGSKFFGGPPFCGALLFPRAYLDRIAGADRLPPGLQAYAALHPGLILRWTAALYEMDRFAALPPAVTEERLHAFGAVVEKAIARYPDLVLADGSEPDEAGWPRSVFTFAVRGHRGELLSKRALQALYRGLAADLGTELPHAAAARRFLIGQPVELGTQAGGLRIAIGARTLTEDAPLSTHETNLEALFAKLSLLRARTPALAEAAE